VVLAMEHEYENGIHILKLEKNEMIMLIAVIHEGLECLRKKSGDGDVLASIKYDNALMFTNNLNSKIMTE
jgi:hypothetical protein